ncbi:hypothetical protein BTO06_10020 [Tenacibaculum sp. SZ-18]|uniref:tyrosine-type recombinase/integrase n=1 Tax=Tenacibaculum sp. SZ-18 TaxID=754423 RepID=UPI000C2D00E8|nr:tyrosine-type recombinase/integrase [Tenacibaculum sp. SZ-18]AUC15457.1 hypothetical protein BTO06_10020 [Tenacibaculum sp. SZ-18]
MTSKKITLVNGCYVTKFKVFPSNWRTGGKELLLKDWIISYYFHDPKQDIELFNSGKRIRVKGMNEFKTLTQRREATGIIIDSIKHSLTIENYNPISDSYMTCDSKLSVIDEDTSIIELLKYALSLRQVSKEYRQEMITLIDRVEISLIILGYQFMNITEFSRKHVKAVLRDQQMRNKISNKRYNKYKSMLSSLFKELIEEEIIEYNPTSNIKKLTEQKNVREVLTDDDRKLVYSHLKENYYTFWRFMMIYFSSGARIKELLRMRVSDVDLNKLEFKVYVLKGGQNKEVIKPINKNELYLWKELINEQNTDRIVVNSSFFIFSSNLQKGEKQIRREQITRRWKTHVKDKLGVTADFASLTHLYADTVASELDLKHAQKLRSHTTDRMMKKHYAINESQRQLERLKNIDIRFVVE